MSVLSVLSLLSLLSLLLVFCAGAQRVVECGQPWPTASRVHVTAGLGTRLPADVGPRILLPRGVRCQVTRRDPHTKAVARSKHHQGCRERDLGLTGDSDPPGTPRLSAPR